MPQDNILQVEDIVVSCGKKQILNHVSFDLEKGSVLAIVGESGSGKTTLAKSILGILSSGCSITHGSIKYKDIYLQELNSKEYSKLYSKELSSIFQNPGSYLNPIIKIGKQFIETLSSCMHIDGNEALEISETMLKKTNLRDIPKILDSYPFELSGGMLQRVSIAMVFALNPALVIADEPTSALDVVSQKWVLDELFSLKEQSDSTLIIITHSLSVASYIADSVMVLHKGEVVEIGSKAQVLGSPKHPYTKELISSAIYLLEQ